MEEEYAIQLKHAARIGNIPFKMATHVDWGPKQPDKTTVEDQKCLQTRHVTHSSIVLSSYSAFLGSFYSSPARKHALAIVGLVGKLSFPFLLFSARRSARFELQKRSKADWNQHDGENSSSCGFNGFLINKSPLVKWVYLQLDEDGDCARQFYQIMFVCTERVGPD